MGVYLVYDSIPDYYIDHLELKDIIYEMANDLATTPSVSEYSHYWISKYVHAER